MKKILLLFLIFVIGCSSEVTCKVESNTSWSGFFADRTVAGSGNQEISLGDDSDYRCVSVQKQTEGGYLRIKISDGDEAETYAPYGVVSGCGGN